MRKKADEDAQVDTNSKLGAPEANHVVELGSVEVVLIEEGEHLVDDLVEQHGQRVHHVVHVSRGHGVLLGSTQKIVERGLHKVGVHDLHDADEDDEQRGDDNVGAKVDAGKADEGEVPDVKDVDVDGVGLGEHDHRDVDDDEHHQEVQRVGRAPGDGGQRCPTHVGDGELKAGGLNERRHGARESRRQNVDNGTDAGNGDAELKTALEGLGKLNFEEKGNNRQNDGHHRGCAKVDQRLKDGISKPDYCVHVSLFP